MMRALGHGAPAPTRVAQRRDTKGGTMAARKKKKTTRRASRAPAELIISKSRVKNAARKCNVSSDFYGALDKAVRNLIAQAEQRALANKRKTLRPQDI